MNKLENLSDTLMPKSSTTAQPTKRPNKERSPIDDKLVHKPCQENVSDKSETIRLSSYPETYINNPLDNEPTQIMKMDENLKSTIKDVLSEEIKALITIIQDTYIKLTNKIEENSNTVTDIQEQLSNYQDILDRLKNAEDQMDQLAIQNQKLNTENLNLKSGVLSLEKQALENNILLTGVPKGPWENYQHCREKVTEAISWTILGNHNDSDEAFERATEIPIASCKRVGKYSVP